MWGDLNPIDGESRNIRYCSECEENVFFCNTDEELVEAIRGNRCVAIVRVKEKQRGSREMRAELGRPAFPDD